MTDTTREKMDETEIEGVIADALSQKDCGSAECQEFMREGSCSLCNARTVLAIPEIKEGQELLEKAKSGKLVELDEDQSRGKYVTWFPRAGEYTCEEAFQMGQVAGELRDKEAGFRRVKVKG